MKRVIAVGDGQPSVYDACVLRIGAGRRQKCNVAEIIDGTDWRPAVIKWKRRAISELPSAIVGH